MGESIAGYPPKEYICDLKRCDLELVLGIEIDPTAGAKTCGKFEFGTSGSGCNPFDGFKTVDSKKGTQEGNLHITNLEFKELVRRAVRIQACKSNVLSTYDAETGKTSFKNSPYPTEEMIAEIYVFKGKKCLTGNVTFDDIKKQMNKTRTGINNVLIRLDEKGLLIQDCIIDGVVYVAKGQQKVKTMR